MWKYVAFGIFALVVLVSAADPGSDSTAVCVQASQTSMTVYEYLRIQVPSIQTELGSIKADIAQLQASQFNETRLATTLANQQAVGDQQVINLVDYRTSPERQMIPQTLAVILGFAIACVLFYR